MADPKQSFVLLAYATVILAVAGLPTLLYWRSSKTALLPAFEKWKVPWNGWAVLLAFIAMIFLPSVVRLILDEIGFYQRLYGGEFPRANKLDSDNLEHQQAAHLQGLWSQTFSAPLIVSALLVGFRYGTGATMEQTGLSRKRLAANVGLGYLGWLVLAPLTFIVFAVAIALLTPNPDKHPLMDLGAHAGQLESAIFAVQAAIFWPVVEELIFRGILLPWLAQEEKPDPHAIVHSKYRGHVCVAIALLLSLQSPGLTAAIQSQQWDRILPNLGPFLFIVLLLPVYLFLPFGRWIQRRTGFASPQTNHALLASAILFAAVHSNVWPTPIPLFVLGVGLGWLALRTRSIVPAVIVHSLFNAVAVIYQRLGGMP